MRVKEAYQERLDAELWEWDVAIEKLSARADRDTDSARIKYQKEIEKLRRKHKEAERMLEELMLRAGEGALDELKSSIESARADLRKAVESASSKIP